MPANSSSEAQTQRKRWVCGTCRNHSSEYERLGIGQCTGNPLTHYAVGRDKLPVCENGARFFLVDLGRRHQGILQDLTGIRGLAGRVKQALLTELANFGKERISRLSGDLNPNEYEAFIADSLARWRFMVCVPFLTGAKEALDEMKSQIPENSLNEILSLLEYGEQYLESAELNPEELSRKDRMRRWGDAKNAFLFLVGNPKDRIPSLQERIRKAAAMDLKAFRRNFAVRQFMVAFGISREEAEKRVNEEFMTDLERTLQDRDSAAENGADVTDEEASGSTGKAEEGPDTSEPEGQEDSPAEADDERAAAIKTLMELPRKERVIEVRQKPDAIERQQTRAKDLMAKFLEAGGSFLPVNPMAPIEAAASNGDSFGDMRVSRRGEGKKRSKKEADTN